MSKQVVYDCDITCDMDIQPYNDQLTCSIDLEPYNSCSMDIPCYHDQLQLSLPDQVTTHPTTINPATSSDIGQTYDYQDIVRILSNVELDCNPPMDNYEPSKTKNNLFFVEDMSLKLPQSPSNKRKMPPKAIGKDQNRRNIAAQNWKTAPKGIGKDQKRRKAAAQAHNMCERRHRNRINANMRALQELIPHCRHKTLNKASLLEQAIEHIKSLQYQIQMMSMMRGYTYQAPYNLMTWPNYLYMQLSSSAAMDMRPMIDFEMVRPTFQMPPFNYAANVGLSVPTSFLLPSSTVDEKLLPSQRS